MKEKWIIRVVFVVGGILLMLFFIVRSPNELTGVEKVRLLKSFYNKNYVMPDTVISYELYSDSLILSFEPKAHYKNWSITVLLTDSSWKEEKMIANSMEYPVINGQMIFRDFHIPEDSLYKYTPRVSAFPFIKEGEVIIWNTAYPNNRIAFQKNDNANLLTPHRRQERHYVSFNLAALNDLPTRESSYLLNFMERKMKSTIK